MATDWVMMCSPGSVLVLVLCDDKSLHRTGPPQKIWDAARHATRDSADAGRDTRTVSINNMHPSYTEFAPCGRGNRGRISKSHPRQPQRGSAIPLAGLAPADLLSGRFLGGSCWRTLGYPAEDLLGQTGQSGVQSGARLSHGSGGTMGGRNERARGSAARYGYRTVR
jgi:hypothetical protein